MDASSKIDQTADRNFSELHRFAKLYSFPDFVKNASPEQIQETELPLTVYADVRPPYQFPCHTKTAAFLSWVWFLEKQAELAPKISSLIEGRLEKFAHNWGITGDVEQLKAKRASWQSDDFGALPDSSFALVWAGDDGQKERRYPLRNALEVKTAAGWFEQHRDAFSFQDRQAIAQKLLAQADRHKAAIAQYDEMLQKQAGRGCCSPKKAAEFVRTRVKQARLADPAVRTQLLALADQVAGVDMLTFNNNVSTKLADTLDQFDRLAGIKYSETTPRLEDVLFGETYTSLYKVASEICTTTTGSIYDVEQFEKLSLGEVREMFGEEFAGAVADGIKVDGQKMAEVAHTLPRPDAQMLDQLMNGAGFAPIVKKSNAHKRPTHAELQHIMRARQS